MLSRIVLFSGAVVLAATALAAGCGGSSSAGGKGSEIVAAFYPLAFAAEQIAGGGVEVRNLTPAGAEPHDLELTPSDVRAVHDASLVLYLGDGFMPGLETAVKQRRGRSSTSSPSCGSRPASAEAPRATPTSGSIRCATPRWCG